MWIIYNKRQKQVEIERFIQTIPWQQYWNLS